MSFPRPFFLSFTVRLADVDGAAQLFDALRRALDWRAAHHIPVAERAWHFTAFALVRARAYDPATWPSFDAQMEGWARSLASDSGIDALAADLREFGPICLDLRELRCSDAGVTFQLRAVDGTLAAMRDAIRARVTGPVHALIESENRSSFGVNRALESGHPFVESFVGDRSKNVGDQAFGSIARSPNPLEAAGLRWSVPLASVTVSVSTIHLLASDEALANPGASRPARSFRLGK